MMKNDLLKKSFVFVIIASFIFTVVILPLPKVISAENNLIKEKIIKNELKINYFKDYFSNCYEGYLKNKILEKNDIIINSQKKILSIIKDRRDTRVGLNYSSTTSSLQDSPVLWEYSDAWSVPMVTMCDNGSYIWVGQRLIDERFQLFRTRGLGLPEWEFDLSGGYYIKQIDSSAQGSVLAGIAINDSGLFHSVLYKWNIASDIPSWNYEFPNDLIPSHLCVSDDGKSIVVEAYNRSQHIVKIIVFDSFSNIPSFVYPIVVNNDYLSTYSLDISTDGTLVLITYDAGVSIGASLIDITIPDLRWEGNHPASISGNGSILVLDNYDSGHFITVLEWDPSEQQYIERWRKYWSLEDWYLCINCHTMEVSNDGSTIIVGGHHFDQLRNKAVMFDTNSGTILFEYYTEGGGTYSNIIYDVRLSYTGGVGVVGYWGDEFDTVPELKIFCKSFSTPFLSVDTSGSIRSVDISPDGKNIVGGCKLVHANEPGRGGVVYAVNVIDNNPPNKPRVPSGFKVGKIGRTYKYYTESSDLNNDQIYYLWEWGDGNFSHWLGPYSSDDRCETSYSWKNKGIYSIRVKAMDTEGGESEWSDPLAVRMPKSKSTANSLLFQFLKKFAVCYFLQHGNLTFTDVIESILS